MTPDGEARDPVAPPTLPPPGAAAHVIVSSVDGEAVAVEPDDVHHLARVLRLRPGEAVTATDGRGRWRACVVSAGSGWRGGLLEPVGMPIVARRPDPALTVGFALIKGDRPEWTVQKLVELGIDRIVVLQGARSVVRWDRDRGARQLERLQSVAREAVMQSRGCLLPEVIAPLRVSEAVAEAQVGRWGPVALAERTGAGGSMRGPSLATPCVFVGPEGGWADHELDAVVGRVALGPNVLRAETAAVVAGAALVLLRTGLVRPLS